MKKKLDIHVISLIASNIHIYMYSEILEYERGELKTRALN